MTTLSNDDELRERLRALQVEHRDLDDVVLRMSKDVSVDQLQLTRLKKTKADVKKIRYRK